MFDHLPLQDLKIVFLENKKIADYFYDKLYKHNVELIIVTGDGSYPKHKRHKTDIWNKIKTDDRVQIIVMSRRSMCHLVNAKTKNIIVLHDILENDIKKDSCYNDYTKNYKFNLNEISFSYLIHIILLLTEQIKYTVGGKESMLVLNKKMEPYVYDKEENVSKLKWQAVLIDPSLNANLKYSCRKIKWSQLLPAWKILWPGRADIKPMSDMYLTINKEVVSDVELDFIIRHEKCTQEEALQIIESDQEVYYGYTHDKRIYDKYTPTFFGVYDQEKLIGVNSGHRTKDDEYRSRGLWVDPDYRGRKIAKILLQATINKSVEEGCKLIWTLPRQSSMPAYNSVGFERKSDWISEGVLYGPNCVAVRHLKIINRMK